LGAGVAKAVGTEKNVGNQCPGRRPGSIGKDSKVRKVADGAVDRPKGKRGKCDEYGSFNGVTTG
jgi:hypothetical protein